MKISKQRNQAKLICVLTATLGAIGCQSPERLVTNAVLAGGGAGLAAELSHGNPWITAGGAVAGSVLGEGIHALRSKREQKTFQAGYTQGRSDTVKAQYWMQVRQQRQVDWEPSYFYYPIPIPEHETTDGVRVGPTTKIIRIQEAP